MKQCKSGDPVKSATALGFPTHSRLKARSGAQGKLVPLLAQPLTAVEPATPSISLPQHQSAPAHREPLLTGQG